MQFDKIAFRFTSMMNAMHQPII